ncbi:MAG: LPXTG cell wall anchor domain-containing protein, partial [Chloroflexota bacterium]|nr:LPXTG cell wall anchor domain-containing protein [Chloroflexota bacterium]
VNRTAIAVAIEVPGPRELALKIGTVGHKAAGGMSFVSFDVSNAGNTHLKPSGLFTLRDAARTELAAAPAVMDSIYAGSATLFEAPLAQILDPGDYCAELSLTDEATGATDATECQPFTVESPVAAAGTGDGSATIPVVQRPMDAAVGGAATAAMIAAGLLALAGGGWLLWRRRRRRLNEDSH